jgi:hypothetical protein
MLYTMLYIGLSQVINRLQIVESFGQTILINACPTFSPPDAFLSSAPISLPAGVIFAAPSYPLIKAQKSLFLFKLYFFGPSDF